jgi:hypothetical protein
MQSVPAFLWSSSTNLEALRLAGIETKDLRFATGESYKGGWRQNKVRLPPSALRSEAC